MDWQNDATVTASGAAAIGSPEARGLRCMTRLELELERRLWVIDGKEHLA
jgi:hypothetical protein